MFFIDDTVSTARPIRMADIDSLGCECITIADLMREWQGHLYEDELSKHC
ncbi:hypothetical protein NGR_c22580 [Sinorhizobium fredii NGR234]|uniref:Uncharacterized protein n=1 Tax=Sinorhizobium fredii (strain NBRC 101917 / NGR234) TaxID=394 RepID=C3MFG1_SINFN|nr:hypothetical protein [Sinorhizobium fredii]ACP26018.1 hypothetical protein NGR_c22580 [Sinorhizobium fredii NGR234]